MRFGVFQLIPSGNVFREEHKSLKAAEEAAMKLAPKSAWDVGVREKQAPRMQRIFKAGTIYLPPKVS